MSDESKSAAQASAPGSSSSSPGSGLPAQAVQKKVVNSRLPGMALTAKQQAVAELKDAGKTNDEIAGILGISPKHVAKKWSVINKKRGNTRAREEAADKRSNTSLHPEQTASLLVDGTDPLAKVREAMRASGFPERTAEAVLRRLRVKYFGATEAVRQLQTTELLKIVDEKIHLLSHYLDDKVAAEASARDIAMGMTQLIEKRQLLRGEPTAIISNDDRKKLHELFPALIEEAKRRGVTVDGQVTEVTVERS